MKQLLSLLLLTIIFSCNNSGTSGDTGSDRTINPTNDTTFFEDDSYKGWLYGNFTNRVHVFLSSSSDIDLTVNPTSETTVFGGSHMSGNTSDTIKIHVKVKN